MPDTHIHLLLACDRKAVGGFVNHVLGGVVRGLDLEGGFDRAWFGPVQTQSHRRSAVHYVLRQHQRHETRQDPFREASNLPDLLGLRPLGAFTAQPIRRLLPRLQPSQLAPYLGEWRPGTHRQWLGEAAAASIAANELRGRSKEAVAARCAAVHWGRGQGHSVEWIAEHLSLSTRTVQRILHQPADPQLCRAIGMQIGLREAHASSATHAA